MRPNETVTLSWPDPGQVEGAFCTSMLVLVMARPKRFDGIARIEGGLEDGRVVGNAEAVPAGLKGDLMGHAIIVR